MSAVRSVTGVPRWQDRLGRGLMALAALGALGAFIASSGAVRASSPEVIWVETWRMFGFLVFAGMYALLALRPRVSAGVWELAFLHKAAMAVTAVALSGVPEAASAGMVDAVLMVMTEVAHCLTRGWRSWRVRTDRQGRP